MRGRVKHLEAMRFLVSGDTSHGLILDSSDEERVLGPGPMEMVMLSAACCSAMDVVYILRKMRQPPEDLEVEVEAQRAEEDPKVFTSLRLRYRLRGENLKGESVERAIRLSRERYCSVVVMLERAGVDVSTDYEVS